jgi:hypothetical protein
MYWKTAFSSAYGGRQFDPNYFSANRLDTKRDQLDRQKQCYFHFYTVQENNIQSQTANYFH